MTDRSDNRNKSLVRSSDKTLRQSSSGLVRRGLNAIERLQSSHPGHDGGQNSGKASQTEGKTQDIFEAMAEVLERQGAVAAVGPSYYEDFVNQNDDEMGELIQLVILASEKELNRILLGKKPSHPDSELMRPIKTKLRLMSRGWLRFGKDGKLYCYKPDGPEPTALMKILLDNRIERAVPQILPTLLDLVKKSVKNST